MSTLCAHIHIRAQKHRRGCLKGQSFEALVLLYCCCSAAVVVACTRGASCAVAFEMPSGGSVGLCGPAACTAFIRIIQFIAPLLRLCVRSCFLPVGRQETLRKHTHYRCTVHGRHKRKSLICDCYWAVVATKQVESLRA